MSMVESCGFPLSSYDLGFPATSAFLSSSLYPDHSPRSNLYDILGIIWEPLKGVQSICPIGDSLDSPELDLPLWLASSETTIKNFIIAKHLPASNFLPHTRVVCLPGFTVTLREELHALKKVAGREVLDLVKFKNDPVNRRIVSTWPARFDNSYALSLGFVADEGGMVPIVRQLQKHIAAGVV